MNNELRAKMSEVYNVNCPICGKKWSFEITGPTSFKQVKACQHAEMEDLIFERNNQLIIAKRASPNKPFANPSHADVKVRVTYGKKE